MSKGFVHLYTGDGKGKTCAAVGSAVRACGAGRRVVFFQFLKNGDSCEMDVLRKTDGITVIVCPKDVPFLFNVSSDVMDRFRSVYEEKIETINSLMSHIECGMLVLDELVDAMDIGLVSKDQFISLLQCTENGCEVIITGHSIKNGVTDIVEQNADYVSEVRKIKHPYDNGVKARRGIEF